MFKRLMAASVTASLICAATFTTVSAQSTEPTQVASVAQTHDAKRSTGVKPIAVKPIAAKPLKRVAVSNPVARKASGKRVAIPYVLLSAAKGRELSQSTAFKANTDGEKYECGSIICVCVGDSDCNDMFTAACSDTSTGGACTEINGQTVCACTPNGS